ncbi:MAG: hypothetical protein HQL37_00835 [Alphaproteobacteria bacterium]|nr:hypothetical protein [Alphaproteobacteria bacterium]
MGHEQTEARETAPTRTDEQIDLDMMAFLCGCDVDQAETRVAANPRLGSFLAKSHEEAVLEERVANKVIAVERKAMSQQEVAVLLGIEEG